MTSTMYASQMILDIDQQHAWVHMHNQPAKADHPRHSDFDHYLVPQLRWAWHMVLIMTSIMSTTLQVARHAW